MRLRHTKRPSLELDLTPLIDVVFLLLIFFMVSTTFQRDAALSIELPEATAKAEQRAKHTIEIAIDAKGRFYVDGKQLINTQTSSLKRALIAAASGRKSPPIVLNADAGARYQSVVSVMDAARQLGFLNLTFAAQLVGEDSIQE